MRAFKNALSIAALAAVFGAGLAAPASAYTACNKEGDCWHTDTRVTFPGVTLSFHNDNWWDAHRSDTHFRWHEADTGHDWHHGYWANGEWHPG